MTAALSDEQVAHIYGTLRLLLHKCPAAKIRIYAGAAGWDLGLIPDGMDPSDYGTRRPPQESAIDGQWGSWTADQKRTTLRSLAAVLCENTSETEFRRALLGTGFGFLNGDFVPLNARGEIEP